MDAWLFHPKLVHVPMALGVLMPLVAGGVLVAWWRKWLPARAWVLVVLLQTALVVSGVVALQSGESEEHRVERVVAERFLEQHEQAAESFVWASAVVLLAMLSALALSARRTGVLAASAATLGTLIVLGLGYRTGQAGGDLVYRHGAAHAYADVARGSVNPVGAFGRSTEDDD